MDAALIDYNRAIDICPWSVDPVLNRCLSCPEHLSDALGHAQRALQCAWHALRGR